MDKESLIKAREEIIKLLDGTEILTEDKLELIINLDKFLEPEKYDSNIKTLRLTNPPKRF